MKEDELNFLTMEIIFYKLFNFCAKITALSGFLFIGTLFIYVVVSILRSGSAPDDVTR